MPANDRMPSLWSRRSLLVALAAGSVTALSGCGVQLEEGAPRIPLVPTRVPMKDEKALLALLGRTTSLGALASAVGGAPTSITGQLSAVHATQVAVIMRLLRDGGVPASLIQASATASPTTAPPAANPTATTPTQTSPTQTTATQTTATQTTPTQTTPTQTLPTRTSPTQTSPTRTSPTTPPLTQVAILSAAERDSVSDLTLADLSNAHVALIGSMLAQHLGAAALLGGTTPPVPSSGLDGAKAVPLLEAVRATVYGFEIVAAQIDSTGRALAMSSLASLRTLAAELQTLAGASSPPPPLGYELPFPVTDQASARRLALHLLAALLTNQATALDPATSDEHALATLVQWLGATQVIAVRWGSPLAAFPGLKNP